MAATMPRADETATKAAIKALALELGEDNVLVSPEQLQEYRDPYDYRGSDEFTGSAVVTPRSVEDVQTIVRLANEFRVPLWTFSTGRNFTYGGPAPRVRGSIQVSCREMNRVLEVDDELAYAVVEPGVRFFDLYDHLRAGGYRLWPSIPDLGWGSIIGNTLDSGRGYTPYGDHPTTQCGLEVVLANGEILRTEMGVWLMRAPEVYVSGWATWRDEGATAAVIDTLRELMFEGVIRNNPLVGYGVPTENGRDPSAGGWMVRFAFYGRESLVEAQYQVASDALTATAGVELGRRTYRGDDERSAATMHDDKVQGGVPGLELIEMFKARNGEDAGHLDLSSIGPLSGADVAETIRFRRELYDRHGLPYSAGIVLLPRTALHISALIFDTNDEQQTRAAYDTYAEMVVELAQAGYPVYRTNIQHMDLVAEQFDWGDHAQMRLNERLKDLLDPNGILSPGKQGIWPQAMRPPRA